MYKFLIFEIFEMSTPSAEPSAKPMSLLSRRGASLPKLVMPPRSSGSRGEQPPQTPGPETADSPPPEFPSENGNVKETFCNLLEQIEVCRLEPVTNGGQCCLQVKCISCPSNITVSPILRTFGVDIYATNVVACSSMDCKFPDTYSVLWNAILKFNSDPLSQEVVNQYNIANNLN